MNMTLTSIICFLTIALLSVVAFTSCSPNAEKKNETIQKTETANEDVPDAETINEWRQAAEQGDADAQYNLGIFYSQDDSVDKDMTEAVKWFRKAAEQGYEPAIDSLANGTTIDGVNCHGKNTFLESVGFIGMQDTW